MSQASAIQRITYDDGITRKFLWASVSFALVGMLVGVIAALQLAFWQANLGVPWLTYSRLRPLHTNAVIFAFVGNMLFAGIYYSTQRLLKARMASDLLSKAHFWGWQLIIVAAAVTLPLGYTSGKEYAELEWPIDVAIAVVWVLFAVNFFWTLKKRHERQLYVAIWFYIATIVTVAVLHIVNSLAIPLTALKSYPVFAGVQDALVQWWYGHNAVAFFLTTPILGIMYYFLPKAADRPIYSYRLSIIHFWALVFMYIWAGPHHLLYTALPEWAQTLGMVFSLMLWAPSWGGMLNGLLTLRGAWGKLRHDVVIKFFVAGLTFYGMSTLEGPILSIKSVNGLAHYTDWIVAHVHAGALGWNGFMAAGMFYWLAPRLWGTKLHSKRAAEVHFWLGTIGILLYVVAMWTAGVTQGLMWRAQNPDGSLVYQFVQTLSAIRPLYWIRMIGGLMYLAGFVLMTWNLWKTRRAGTPVDGAVEVAVTPPEAVEPGRMGLGTIVGAPGFLAVVAGIALTMFLGTSTPVRFAQIVLLLLALVEFTVLWFKKPRTDGRPAWHGLVEGRSLVFTVLVLVAVLVGGVAELVPTIVSAKAVPHLGEKTVPYAPLELEGRDLYLREGCYTCHSQMVRPMLPETKRYGAFSRPEEFLYDHPFQWGSKRTGPDLHRVGGKYPDLWHYTHLIDPRATSPGSNMPSYAWLKDGTIDVETTPAKLATLRKIGVPYGDDDVATARTRLRAQAEQIVAGLAEQGVTVRWDSEMVAMIAYLQRLGRNPKAPEAIPPGAAPLSQATPAVQP